MKCQFCFVKIRYHGLAKNAGQIVTLYALTNLWLAGTTLLPLVGEICESNGEFEVKPKNFIVNRRRVENRLFLIICIATCALTNSRVFRVSMIF